MSPVEPRPVDMADPVMDGARRMMKALARYHRHRVHGLEHIPTEGPAVVAVNHSLATYDVALLVLAVYEYTGRVMRGLGDRSLFQTPVIRSTLPRIGAVDADPAAARALLEAGELVVVAPGGMREALRTRAERYQVQWEDRRGFARLAIQTGAPVVLAACPRADEVFTAYANPLTPRIYARLKLPVPLARGLGPTLVPRPIALTHVVRPPRLPPDSEAGLETFHGALVHDMTALMDEARERRW